MLGSIIKHGSPLLTSDFCSIWFMGAIDMFKHNGRNTQAEHQVAVGRHSGWVTVLLAVLTAGLAPSQFGYAQQPANRTPQPSAKVEQPSTKPAPAADSHPATTPQTAAAAGSFATSPADHYRIGPGDVLDIRVLNRANLSRDNVRVEGDGTVRMPLIEGQIQAACQTETELATEINRRYLKFYRNPQVDVFIKEYRSTQVAIIGQVNDQSRFLLQRRIKLLELLTYAKGPSAQAGQTINVIHSGTAFQCTKRDSSKDEIDTGLSSYRLSATLRGEEKANPYLENGDIITVPEADQVYVVGNVLAPRIILLKEPITLTRAIAMSGGLAKDTKKDKIRIVRQEPGSTTKKEIYVDLAAIEKKQAEDIPLVANDIVDVPISGTKSMLRSVVTGLGSSATQLPLRVIP
jgi:polysaccharide export outer membrane protein